MQGEPKLLGRRDEWTLTLVGMSSAVLLAKSANSGNYSHDEALNLALQTWYAMNFAIEVMHRD